LKARRLKMLIATLFKSLRTGLLIGFGLGLGSCASHRPQPDLTLGCSSEGEAKEPALQCLARAETLLQELGLPTAIAADYRQRFSRICGETDRGPAKWFNCAPSQLPQLELATWVHEMGHELGRPDCLYTWPHGEFVCLALDSNLPPRAVARLQAAPTTRRAEEAHSALEFLQAQQSYLTVALPFALFDELNSSTLTTTTMTALVPRWGQNLSQRPAQLLPLYLVYTLRYLEYVRTHDFAQYRRNFGRNAGNWQALEQLLHNAEAVYLKWAQALKGQGLREFEIEHDLWMEYLRLRTRLYLLN